MSANPILVEVTRGDIVESVHRGAYAVVDASGTVVEQAGDVARAIYPRSAIKAMQALAFVEAGAADAFGFTDPEIALTCASHRGEPEHVTAARSMLGKLGLSESDLECGPQWPTAPKASAGLTRSGEEPTPIHNNCSGKHAGMLAFAKHAGLPTRGYVGRDHDVQKAVAAILNDLCGVTAESVPCGVDGCSVPTWAIPIERLAHGFARYATGEGLSESRFAACRKIAEAVYGNPFMIDGTGGFGTRLIEAVPGKAFVKYGAEGVFCGFFPEQGLGFTIKCDDGAERAVDVATAALARKLGAIGQDDVERLAGLLEPPVRNRRGAEVGVMRPAGPLQG